MKSEENKIIKDYFRIIIDVNILSNYTYINSKIWGLII